jgi:hypothetical protein
VTGGQARRGGLGWPIEDHMRRIIQNAPSRQPLLPVKGNVWNDAGILKWYDGLSWIVIS